MIGTSSSVAVVEIEEHAGDEEDQVGDDQQHQRILRQAEQRGREGLRHLLDGEDPPEECGRCDDDQDSRGAARGQDRRIPQVRQSKFAVEKRADQDHIDRRHRGRLGRREYAERHARNHQGRSDNGRKRREKGARHFPCGCPALGPRMLVEDGHDEHGQHQQDRAYQRRHDARDQELNDRDAGDGAVDDQRDRRREDRPERRRSTCDRSGEGRIEAALLHGVDLDAAKPANIGERGPRHAGENEAAEDVYLRQSTGNAADQRVGEAEDAVGDAGQVHQIADEDEQRDRHQREGIEGVGDALGEQP